MSGDAPTTSMTLPSEENAPAPGAALRRAMQFLSTYGTIIGMALMIVIFSVAAPRAFPTYGNFLNVLNQASLVAIIAGGLTVTVIVGELDLSIGFAASWAGVLVTGLMVHEGMPPWLAILAVLASGAVIGVINGLIVTKLRVNSVIATLGTGTIIVGLNFAYTTGAPIASGVPFSFVDIALGRTLGVPNDILIMIAVLVVLWILVNRTELGQSIQAIGGNAEAARLSGIRVHRVKILAYVISGLTAALTGILLASLLGSGTSSAADAYLLTAFAAVFLGSATLRDGEFHILGTFIAVLIISIGFNGLAIFGAPTFFQYLFQGIILIAAVALSSLGRVYAGR